MEPVMATAPQREFRDDLVTTASADLPERFFDRFVFNMHPTDAQDPACLLYTSDAADERSSVDLGGRRIINKKNNRYV